MTPNTQRLLRGFDAATWFARVGEVVPAGAAISARSWDDAARHCASRQTDDVWNEAANVLSEALFAADRCRFNDTWNETVADVKVVLVPVVTAKAEPLLRRHKLPPKFVSTVRYALTNACMESEYADIVPPGFFSTQASWYLRGHFPCGYVGKFPRGSLVIY